MRCRSVIQESKHEAHVGPLSVVGLRRIISKSLAPKRPSDTFLEGAKVFTQFFVHQRDADWQDPAAKLIAGKAYSELDPPGLFLLSVSVAVFDCVSLSVVFSLAL